MDGGHAENVHRAGSDIHTQISSGNASLAGGPPSIRSFAGKRAGGMKKAGTGDASAAPGSVE